MTRTLIPGPVGAGARPGKSAPNVVSVEERAWAHIQSPGGTLEEIVFNAADVPDVDVARVREFGESCQSLPPAWALVVCRTGLYSSARHGVESQGFVPPGFITIGKPDYAYLSDRGTPDNPFPGTESLLRLSSGVLAAAGVEDGVLLAATEGNGTTIAIASGDTRTSLPVAQGPQGGHVERHLLVVP